MENDGAEETTIFDLSLDDDELVTLLRSAVQKSDSYWQGNRKGQMGLKNKRERNYRYWQGDQWNGVELYDHQIDYTDNRVFSAVETTIPMVTQNIAQPSVMPGNPESPSSVELAKDIEKALFRLAEINDLDVKMEIITRDDLLQYVGCLKMYFDPDYGRDGEIMLKVVAPENLIVDHDVDMFEEPRFIAEKVYWDLAEILDRFPEKAKQLFTKLRVQPDKLYMHTTKYECWEVWFTYYDKETYEEKEGVAWFMENGGFVLGKMESPCWVEETSKKYRKNYFDAPTKPYILLNNINSGRRKIDDNAPIDQAIKQQDIVNKRGRQITENADNAQGGIVYNTKMISAKDMAKLVGAPDEKIGVTGDVNKAFARVAPPLLPQYVQEQLYDARNQIDDYFATHKVTRGDQSNFNTLGEAVLQKNQDYGRNDRLLTSVERTTLKVYKMMLQFMKVYYDKDHYLMVAGDSGQFDYVVIRSDDIEDGLDVMVQKGSTAPVNKDQNKTDVMMLAKMGMVDPYTVIEVIQTGVMPSPQKVMQRLMDWLANKEQYLQSVKEDSMNREAQIDIQQLNRGEWVEPRSEPTAEYLESRNNYIASGEFLDLPRNIQELHLRNLEENKQNAQRMLSLKEAMNTRSANDLAASTAAGNEAGMGNQPIDPMNPPNKPPAPPNQSSQIPPAPTAPANPGDVPPTPPPGGAPPPGTGGVSLPPNMPGVADISASRLTPALAPNRVLPDAILPALQVAPPVPGNEAVPPQLAQPFFGG